VKILLLAPQPFFEVRGTPLAVRAMLETLTGRGHRVRLLTYPQGEPVSMPGLSHSRSLPLPVGRVPPGPSAAKLLLDVPFMLEAALWMLFGRFDAVHAVEEAAPIVAPLSRLLGLPLVVDVDSWIPDQLRESGFAGSGPLLGVAEAFYAHALRHSAVVVTVCRSLTDSVTARAPLARVFQVEDPPLVTGPADPAAVSALRRELSLTPAPIVLYSGNFEPYQGVELLLEAAAAVSEVQLVLMGGEPSEIESMRPRAGAACVFAGKRPASELPAFLALADVLVSPRCRGTNTPFKLYTYLASGTPLVATRIPTHPQLLDDSLATLVEPTAPDLAAGIRKVLADPAAAKEKARRGQELIERDYSRARYTEKVARAYAVVEAAARPDHAA